MDSPGAPDRSPIGALLRRTMRQAWEPGKWHRLSSCHRQVPRSERRHSHLPAMLTRPGNATWSTQDARASSTAPRFLAITARYARVVASGFLRPCSHSCNVLGLIQNARANSACDIPAPMRMLFTSTSSGSTILREGRDTPPFKCAKSPCRFAQVPCRA